MRRCSTIAHRRQRDNHPFIGGESRMTTISQTLRRLGTGPVRRRDLFP
jgi:hypothetical protein